jgi:hypothetical protein
LGESFRREDAAADRPKQAGTGPSHALKKAAAIDPVVFVVVRNVIGHDIWFCLGCSVGRLPFTFPYRFGALLFPKLLVTSRSLFRRFFLVLSSQLPLERFVTQ